MKEKRPSSIHEHERLFLLHIQSTLDLRRNKLLFSPLEYFRDEHSLLFRFISERKQISWRVEVFFSRLFCIVINLRKFFISPFCVGCLRDSRSAEKTKCEFHHCRKGNERIFCFCSFDPRHPRLSQIFCVCWIICIHFDSQTLYRSPIRRPKNEITQ